jgi:hypoxanthine phosphoribosyltransferase
MRHSRLTWSDAERLTQEVCRQISLSDWRPDLVVAVTRGGAIPGVLISQYFDVAMQPLRVSLRQHAECESNLWLAEQAFGANRPEETGITGARWDPALRKNILIVDDINDSGATFDWIVKDWQSGCFPQETETWTTVWNRTTRFAVLVDNLASNARLPVDYAGSEINKAEEDVWIDFPWEVWWR